MFRLTAFLIAGMYLALLIGGADHGQKRFGLRDAPVEKPSVAAVAEVEPPAAPVEAPPAPVPDKPAIAAALPQGVANMPLVSPASFEPEPGTEVFSLANANTGLMDLVPDEEAAAALSRSSAPSQPAAEPAQSWAVVTAAAVNVRSGPSTADTVAGRLVQGDEVVLVGPEVDGWVQVRVEGDGIDGFVAARFLAPRAGE